MEQMLEPFRTGVGMLSKALMFGYIISADIRAIFSCGKSALRGIREGNGWPFR